MAPSKRSPAFTLLEILAAMAVFVLLLVLVTQISGQTMAVISASQRRVEALQSARTVLDSMGSDLANLVRRHGGVLIAGQSPSEYTPPSDSMAFVCASRPHAGVGNPADVRFLAISVGVRLFENKVIGVTGEIMPMVSKGVGPVPWNGNFAHFSNAAASAANALEGPAGITDISEPLSEGVFRMEVVYLLNDGSITPNPPALVNFASTPALGPGTTAVDLSRVRAIIVAVAALDKTTLRLVADAGEFQKLAEAFPALTELNKTPMQLWSSTPLPDSLPKRVKENLRVLQRTFYLPSGGRS